MALVGILTRFDPAEVEMIDQARGLMPRQRFIREAIVRIAEHARDHPGQRDISRPPVVVDCTTPEFIDLGPKPTKVVRRLTTGPVITGRELERRLTMADVRPPEKPGVRLKEAKK